ncbi:hypothetical protein UFOVP1292_4 [uncultured Caudovirales phage]|uniref:Uncharacterized protein n=1 Tax=uncultured Caudovirales phage TaxID=2100421 RepID=A0A6J5P972_9CAUD|nr:hypothetical protein UFOVP859_8 [uncultured Caudovirales phage]CAB4168420.1 hypothetical protein UFOVP882_3 [uncultured Caudovirales phage]CAB4196400.1 hypothetical protein UFOVP1292_4 [uncultured Caudovirales phage]CAB4205372.1 hypothetical protein UFOVP1411_78 [uncultured Caudovirales phage]
MASKIEEDNPENTSNHYEDLIQDSDYVSGAYHTLKAFGIDVDPEDPKAIVDTFLTRNRYFSTNLAATGYTYSKAKDFDAETKHDMAYVMDRTEKMPSFYEKGGAPAGSAILDYALAAITDPTNIVSAIAAMFTAGAGGSAAVAGKTAATAAVRASLKSDLVGTFTGAGLKTLMTEGAISGAGSLAQNALQQTTEQDIGLRNEEDGYNLGEMALNTVAGGIGAPVAGGLIGVGGKGLFRGAGKVIDSSDNLTHASNWLKRNFTSSGGVSEDLVRDLESIQGVGKDFAEKAENATMDLAESIKKDIDPEADVLFNGNTVKWNDVLNEAMQNPNDFAKNPALKLVETQSPDTVKAMQDYFQLRDLGHHYGILSALPDETRDFFSVSLRDQNYTRNVAEAYTRLKRDLPFDEYLAKEQLKGNDVLGRVKDLVMSNPAKYNEDVPIFGEAKITAAGKKEIDKLNNNKANLTPDAYDTAYADILQRNQFHSVVASQEAQDKMIRDFAEERYAPNRMRRQEAGVFKAKKEADIPPVMRELMGYNNNVAIRASESVRGIVDNAVKANVTDTVGRHAVDNGLGVRINVSNKLNQTQRLAEAKAIAEKTLGTDDVVPLIRVISKDMSEQEKRDTIFLLGDAVASQDMKDIFVTKDFAKMIKPIVNDVEDGTGFGSLAKRDDIVGSIYRGTMQIQQAIKRGKTTLSPLSHLRNMGSSLGYVAASGNLMEIAPVIRQMATESGRDFLSQKISQFNKLGMGGTSIDVNQAAKTFVDVTGGSDQALLAKLLTFGKTGKMASKLYAGTDNMAKFVAWLGEEKKAAKIFAGMSAADKQAARDSLTNRMTRGNMSLFPKISDADVISEMAAVKTTRLTPVYDRVPPFLKAMNDIPILGTFTSYPAERLRNTYNIFKTATEEIRQGFETGNSAMRNAGISRLSQWTATQGALWTAVYGANAAMHGDKVNDIIDYARQGLPEWDKNDPILITHIGLGGMFKYINVGGLNPDQQLQSVVMPLILKASRGEDVSKDLDKAMIAAGGKLFEPYIGKSMLTDAGQTLYGLITTGEEKYAVKLAKIVEPGFAKMIRDGLTDSGALRNLGPAGYDLETAMQPRNFGAMPKEGISFLNTVGILGAREKEVDPKVVTGFTLNTLNREIAGDRNKFKTDYKSTLSDPSANYNTVSMLKDYDSLIQKEFKQQQAIYSMVNSLERLGLDRHDIKKMILSKDLSGVAPSEKDLKNIMNGRFSPLEYGGQQAEWKGIRDSIRGKLGEQDDTPFVDKAFEVRDGMRELERNYKRAELAGKPPKFQIGD